MPRARRPLARRSGRLSWSLRARQRARQSIRKVNLMNPEQLMELMQTLDDSWNAQDWKTFSKRHAKDCVVKWPNQPPTLGIAAHAQEGICGSSSAIRSTLPHSGRGERTERHWTPSPRCPWFFADDLFVFEPCDGEEIISSVTVWAHSPTDPANVRGIIPIWTVTRSWRHWHQQARNQVFAQRNSGFRMSFSRRSSV